MLNASIKFFIFFSLLIVVASTRVFPFNEIAEQTSDEKKMAIEKTQKLIQEIVEESFPELTEETIRVKTFKSQKTFFKAQFSISRYITFRKLRTTIYINQLIFQRKAPQNGLRAILAHELAHILYFKRKNRLELLGLIGLANGGFNAKFERRTDLVAIERGYGAGLIEYREWLYQNVTARDAANKRRNYFTPEEITLLISALKDDPEIFTILKKKVPRDLDEVKLAVGP